MRVAITGARGRLGRVLRRYLSETGYQVTALSRNEDAAHQALTSLPLLIEEERVDCILHLAWSTVPSTAEKNPGVEWAEDLPLLGDLLRTLARRAETAGTSPRLIFFSTCAVYGEPEEGDAPFEESCAPKPRGWYAAGKLAAEELVQRFSQECGVPSLILRVTNPYGFSQADQCMQGVLPAMVTAAQRGEVFRLWGDGRAMKDYLHVDDFTSAIDSVLKGGQTGLLNVASGQSIALNDVIKEVEAATGRSLKLSRHEPSKWDVQAGRYSHSALTESSGWRPQVFFAEGIPRFVCELQDQRGANGR